MPFLLVAVASPPALVLALASVPTFTAVGWGLARRTARRPGLHATVYSLLWLVYGGWMLYLPFHWPGRLLPAEWG